MNNIENAYAKIQKKIIAGEYENPFHITEFPYWGEFNLESYHRFANDLTEAYGLHNPEKAFEFFEACWHESWETLGSPSRHGITAHRLEVLRIYNKFVVFYDVGE